MSLIIFSDALSYTYINKYYADFLDGQQTLPLRPNIAYSSNLHWQLFCNIYPDEIGFFTDWVYKKEQNRFVRFMSRVLSPFDNCKSLSMLMRKALDHYVMRDLAFANIPFFIRSDFTSGSRYLFWDKDNFTKYPVFDGYTVISQDVEGDFDKTVEKAKYSVTKNLFLSFGFADMEGHRYMRDENYDKAIHPYMEKLKAVTDEYSKRYPDESILIVSDHGMHTVTKSVNINLEKQFGRQTKNTYFAYIDSCIMRVYCKDKSLQPKIAEYLENNKDGHLLTEAEREYYGVTDKSFGDLIFNLYEGNVFDKNWFGVALRKVNRVGMLGNGIGMHGFWPSAEITDHTAVIMLKSHNKYNNKLFSYREAYEIIGKER